MAIDRRLLCLLLVLPLAACNEPAQQPLLGTLEWDRIGLPAEVSERVLEWKVSEGEQVVSGQLLLELDPRRLDARVRQAEAELNQANARLEELSNGARIEQIQAASASLQQARAERDEAVRDERRISALYARGQVAVAERDRARATRDRLVAASEASAARLRELTNGTRPEQVEQASAAVEAATAQLEAGPQGIEGPEGAKAPVAAGKTDTVHRQFVRSALVFDMQAVVDHVDLRRGAAASLLCTTGDAFDTQALAVLAVLQAIGGPAATARFDADAATATDTGQAGIVQRLHRPDRRAAEQQRRKPSVTLHNGLLSWSGTPARCLACGCCHRSWRRRSWSAGSSGHRHWRRSAPCSSNRPGWPRQRRSCRP